MERNNRGGEVTLEKLLLWYGHPVGSYYWSDDPTEPAMLFGGGTWVRVKGRVLVGVDSGDTNFTVGKEGGSKYMQKHTHKFKSAYGIISDYISSATAQVNSSASTAVLSGYHDYAGNQYGLTMQTEGTGESGNLQPYRATYCWRRTA